MPQKRTDFYNSLCVFVCVSYRVTEILFLQIEQFIIIRTDADTSISLLQTTEFEDDDQEQLIALV